MYQNKIQIEDKMYDLKYDVFELDDASFVISVSKEFNKNIIDKSTIRLAPITFDGLTDIMGIMCRNTVTPTSFREIAEDMIVDRVFVE